MALAWSVDSTMRSLNAYFISSDVFEYQDLMYLCNSFYAVEGW